MKTIILLHGAIGASDQLLPLSDTLSSLGYRTEMMDFPGHGQKDLPDQLSISLFAEELKQFITDKKLEQPHVFGYSMGGYVALYLAATERNSLGKIITLGSKFHWTPDIAQNEIKMLDPKTILDKVPNFAVSLKNRHGEKWERLLNKTAEMMLALGQNNVLSEELVLGIKNEVLIGLADKDNMVSLDETRYVYSRLKNAGMYMLSNTKHPIETVDVSVLGAIISSFLK